MTQRIIRTASWRLATCALLFCCAAPQFTHAADAPVAPPAAAAPTDAPPPDLNEQTGKLLQKPMTVDFKEVALREALEFIRDSAGVDMVVEWPKLAAAGLEPITPVTLKLKQARPAEVVLQVLFRALGGGLEMNVDQGIVFIGIAPKPQEGPPELKLQTYDIADLIAKAPEAGKPDEQAARIITLVQQVVEPESWQANGGSGVIVTYKNRLFVRGTEAVHTAIGQFIIVLRQRLPE